MTTLDRICALEARRAALNSQEWRDMAELAELRDINAALSALWHRRRMEISGAQTQSKEEYKRDRAGHASTTLAASRTFGRDEPWGHAGWGDG